MTKWIITLLPVNRTSIAASSGSSAGPYSSSIQPKFEKAVDRAVVAEVIAEHIAYEGGFVILYNESPFDPEFIASQQSLACIERGPEGA